MRTVTDAQVRRLFEEMSKHGRIGRASMKAGMDRKTGRKYWKAGKVPSQIPIEHTWRTREDPFEADWPDVELMLEDAPELEAKALFEHLLEQRPGEYQPGQVRTLQRRVKRWRALCGPDKEVFFPQEHRAGESMQTDFTWATELEITIGGEPFPHMLCHPVLPYSNWEWATVCQSESLAALRRGIQEAVFRLGCRPIWHQTDNSTAATHDPRRKKKPPKPKEGESHKRAFNAEYAALMKYLGMKPRTIQSGKSNQNGDSEALHGVLKRRLEQHLLLRGSRDFESIHEYELWLWDTLEKANQLRSKRLAEELAVMRPLQVRRLPDYTEERVGVSPWSTIRVKQNTYSVPSRLIGERVAVRLYEDRLEIRYAGQVQLSVERLLGRNGHKINYRHVIWSLVRKPGAFDQYRYREDLFPTIVFRRAYDVLAEACETTRRTDIEYLRILHLAASTMESEVEAALELLLDDGIVPRSDRVKPLVSSDRPTVPDLPDPQPDLASYDELLGVGEGAGR